MATPRPPKDDTDDTAPPAAIWKTEGHPWVDTKLQVATSWGVPLSYSTAVAQSLTGNMVAFGPVDEKSRKPALGRVVFDPPPQMPSLVGCMACTASLAVDLTGIQIQELQTQQQPPPSSTTTTVATVTANANDSTTKEGDGNTNTTIATTTTTIVRQPTITLRLAAEMPNATLLQNVQERYRIRLEHYLKESILPPLVALAALEEATLQLVQQRIAEEDAVEAARASRRGNSTGNSKSLTGTSHPPLYYSKHPTSYMMVPSVFEAATTNNVSNSNNNNNGSGDPTKEYLSSTPSSWLNRIKVGCQQAYHEYLTQQQQEQQLLQLYTSQMAAYNNAVNNNSNSISNNNEHGAGAGGVGRSSSRLSKLASEQWDQKKALLEQTQRQRTTRSAVATANEGSAWNKGVEAYLKGRRIATFLETQWELEQQNEPQNKDNESEDEEEEEGGEEVVALDDEDEDDMDLFNPHLQPAYGDVLKLLRKIRMEDIQESIPYWCQEAHSRSIQKRNKKKQEENDEEEEEEEMDNVLEIPILPLDTMILGIPEASDKEENEAPVETTADTATDAAVAMDVESTVKTETVRTTIQENKAPTATASMEDNGPVESESTPPAVVEIPAVKSEESNGTAAKTKTKTLFVASESPLATTNDSKADTSISDRKVQAVAEEEEEIPVESVVIQWDVPSAIEKAPPKSQVYKYLQSQDHTTFGRYKFALRRKDEELERLQQVVAAKEPDEEQIQRELEEQSRRKDAERAFQKEKAYNKWRFEGIHGGYTVWPKWQHAVEEWQAEHNVEQAATSAAIQHTTDGVPAVPAAAAQEDADRRKALELAEKEKEEEAAAAAGSRRATRRKAASSSGTVFYGQSSQLTAKQLVELILRLCSEKKAPTIFQLQSIVAEDGTQDPVRRLRTALGKLVWRRNQLARLAPSTAWTDQLLCDTLKKKPLLQISAILAEPAAVSDAEAKSAASDDQAAEKESLMRYLQSLHETELHLRKIVLEHLTDIPIPIVATAADERKNSNEGYDSADFEDQSSIAWENAGHSWIGKHIFRPRQMINTNDLSQCEWFTIKSFVSSVMPEGAEEPQPIDGSSVKESPLVDRRMRFRAAPFVEDETNVDFGDDECLVLTEAQVQAGMKAAAMEHVNMDREEEEEAANIVEHPFSGSGVSAKITLYPLNEKTPEAEPLHFTVVGHNSKMGDETTETVHRILMLPDGTNSNPTPDAVWATLDVYDGTEIRCQLEKDPTKNFRIQQSDFHSESQAFAECRNIVAFLERHNKAEAFQEPVDYVALGIPDYPKVVAHPMDVSTLSDKLEQGHYSNIPPKQRAGRSPVARMLNGPFRDDVELIFDNAMLFNPPNDGIHQCAAAVKKAVLRKMDAISTTADLKYKRSGKHLQKQSIYIDEDSDVDMYEYESDNDDDFDYGGARKRKRSKGKERPKSDDNSTRAMEQGIRLQKTLSETLGLRGPFANFRIDNEASTFSLPPQWGCRRKLPTQQNVEEPINGDDSRPQPVATSASKHEEEFSELVELTRTLDEADASGLRRSTRAVATESNVKRGKKTKTPDIEFTILNEFEAEFVESSEELSRNPAPSTRSDVEYICEHLHDSYYADLYKLVSDSLEQSDFDKSKIPIGGNTQAPFGSFANGSFPPYLGRMVPVSLAKYGQFSWEVRAPFQIAALRWVLRGLIKSGHIGEVEPMEQDNMSSGVIMTNHVYYTDSNLQPFEVLDAKELARRRKVNNEEDVSSEDEVELSEYEKMRAERVARNAERLKSLGLA